MTLGFIGLGRMGEPMAANLLTAGFEVAVWNRSSPAVQRLAARGAVVHSTPFDLLAACDFTMEMLASEEAIATSLQIGSAAFAEAVGGRGVVHMGTTSPEFSASFHETVDAAGGWYVEAPVLGSRIPAEQASLVAMVAGEDRRVESISRALNAMCGTIIRCGQPPSATLMKLAVNVHLIGTMTSLVEAWNFAESLGLDVHAFATVITTGQVNSPIAGVKLNKLIRGDFTPQASVENVAMNASLIHDAAHRAGISTPLLEQCRDALQEAMRLGHAQSDVIGLLHAFSSGRDVARSDGEDQS